MAVVPAPHLILTGHLPPALCSSFCCERLRPLLLEVTTASDGLLRPLTVVELARCSGCGTRYGLLP